GEIDKTLFIKRHKDDILLVQVYVDDIIFGSTKKEKSDGIFIDQDKYVAEVLKKFDFVNVKTASTPMESNKPLIKDEEAEDVDVHLYRLMIGSLMYLTASRTDITFDVCARPSDYAGAGLDRKSATGGCQFLGKRRLKKIGSGRRVKSPMEKDGLGAQEDASKQGRMIDEIDQNAEIALDDETQGRANNDEMFRVDDLAGEEVVMDIGAAERLQLLQEFL
nr:hypothetical protein [Tanacetum cinerariifolium]